MQHLSEKYLPSHAPLQVYALVDTNSNGTVDFAYSILNGLDNPNGVAWRNGSLFVAEVTRVLRFDDVDAQVLSGKVGSALSTWTLLKRISQDNV